MKKYKINENEYELIENYKEGFDENLVKEKVTEYFNDYDYIVGDWSYGKIRLKGFCDKKNPLHKKINSFDLKDEYIKNSCAYDCRYFVLKK
ncbi:MAG: DUF1027 domain-containing protein [Bacilli bacterium]|nr:DUF1027 domain-containing protein [Bacilli bacterium]MDD4283063.1 DUF1027 domain-containing protein [Bacilli bacterium]MDD4718488.1 DUF1027 domain-containing protein [Bacilli bacterium]